MKKLLTTISAALFFCFTIRAQHIPDNNFAKGIRTRCSECIDSNNNLLPAAQRLEILHLQNAGIESVSGLEGFSSLQVLDVSSNNISNLPFLPPKLTTLDINSCPLITSLRSLPSSLIYLWCENTGLTSLPALPESLDGLYATNTPITILPKIPSGLISLFICNTKLTTLPPLPDGLQRLEISDSTFSCIPCNNGYLTVRGENSSYIGIKFCEVGEKSVALKVPLGEEKKSKQKIVAEDKETKPGSIAKDNGKCISGNCINGIGVYVTKDGGVITSTYKGSFKDGKFDGKGTFTSTVGSYTGDFKNDLMEGNGTLVFKNGKKQTGIFKEGKLWSGTGYFEFGEKESYNGGIKDYKPDGQGVYIFPNGKNFTGSFSKGVAVNGKGYLFNPDNKSSYEGTFVNGNLSGIGLRIFSQGTLSGNFIDGELNGNGKWTSPDGDKYEGNFKNGNFDGYGVATSKNGRVYKGNWADGKKNGTGSQYDANGNLEYNGDWNNGEKTSMEKSVSNKDELWEQTKEIFSRIIFKGQRDNYESEEEFIHDIIVEFHIMHDYTFFGNEEEVVSPGYHERRRKVHITGTYDPDTHKIHIVYEKQSLHEDILEAGDKWTSFGSTDAEVYRSTAHPGYYVINGQSDGHRPYKVSDYY